jgi:GT2 family glycosyltransferase
MPALAVLIATTGRATLLRETVALLASQTRRPDLIVVSAHQPEDVDGLERIDTIPLEIVFSEKGLPRQRNAGIEAIGRRASIVTFFDDDFLPAPTYLQQVELAFAATPNLVGVTGRLIADGIKGTGISVDRALRLIAEDVAPAVAGAKLLPALYGCNFSVLMRAAQALRFDEDLPLYGWQEDVDFSYQLGLRGVLIRSDALAGVHLGAKSGRTSGKRLGYSQIANPVYLLRKRTIPPRLAWRLMLRNLGANALRSFRPEDHIDRPGRLYGNLVALMHLMTGRLHPTKILTL